MTFAIVCCKRSILGILRYLGSLQWLYGTVLASPHRRITGLPSMQFFGFDPASSKKSPAMALAMLSGEVAVP